MNNDTVATAGWLGKMVALAESDKRIGLVNPKSESPGSLSLEEYSCVLSRNKGEFLETNQCMGFCMLIKREVLERIGYLDEIYGIGGFDDTDYSKRANAAGYKCVCAKDAYVYHEWHTSFKKTGNREMLVRRNEKIFFDKWGKYLRVGYPISYKKDTFYIDINTSLALAREWNWVHAWLNMSAPLKSELRSLKLAEHQSLRLLNLPGNTTLFYFGVLSKLIGRRLKGKKVFDVILVSDKALFRFLSTFKRLFSIPLVYIDKNKFHYCKEGENDKDIWRERARGIAEFVKKGKAT
ncbi:MAG: glycosyltransferase family 2 protein [Candidatus Omnitrophica bacterium]|nr:glycosyltransferase family 2 protein [Candidatus Omnitrophota bacterium]